MEIDTRDIAHRTRALLAVLDADGRFVWVNPRWEERLGWAPDDLVGGSMAHIADPEHAARTEAAIAQLREAPWVAFTNLCRTKSGARVWLQWSAERVEERFYVHAHDVSARVSSEESLREHLTRWEMASQVAAIGFWHVDMPTRTVFWSDQLYSIAGLTRESFEPSISRSVSIMHPDDRPMVRLLANRAIDHGEDFRYMGRVVRPSGEIRHIVNTGQVVLDAAGVPTRMFGVTRDVTDDDSMQSMHDFFYVVSHDLKEPVRTARSFLRLVLDDEDEGLSDQARQFLGFASDASERLEQLIAAVIEFTRTGALLPVQPTDLDGVVREALDDLAPRIDEAGARIEVRSLPRVLGPPVRLRQVFSNLLSNAIKFHRPDVAPTIVIEGRVENTYAVVTVTDDGIGIPASSRSKAFRVFQRLDKRGAIPGSGIGLAIVKRVVSQYGGHVSLGDNPDGPGTQVTLQLPWAPVTQAD